MAQHQRDLDQLAHRVPVPAVPATDLVKPPAAYRVTHAPNGEWVLIIKGAIVDRFATQELATRCGEAWTTGRRSWEVGCAGSHLCSTDFDGVPF